MINPLNILIGTIVLHLGIHFWLMRTKKDDASESSLKSILAFIIVSAISGFYYYFKLNGSFDYILYSYLIISFTTFAIHFILDSDYLKKWTGEITNKTAYGQTMVFTIGFISSWYFLFID